MVGGVASLVLARVAAGCDSTSRPRFSGQLSAGFTLY
jgi:hypothetical protein